MSKSERITLYWPRGPFFWRPRRPYGEGRLLAGQRHGKWVFWYGNGEKQLEGEYANGKKTGLWIKWAREGSKLTEGNFVCDKMHGIWTDWHGTGQKALESQWIMGKRNGKWTYWATDGTLVKTEQYDARYEDEKAYSLYTDLEEKEILRQIHKEKVDSNWEKLVGRAVARLVQPWHVACWVLLFIAIFSLTRTKMPWRAAAFAGVSAFLITSLLAWSLERRGRR